MGFLNQSLTLDPPSAAGEKLETRRREDEERSKSAPVVNEGIR